MDSKTATSDLTVGQSNTTRGLIQPKKNCKNYGKLEY